MIEHPMLYSITFVGAQLVCALIGYFQGRRTEELYWRRVVGTLDRQTGHSPDRWSAP